jgi:ribonucleoside-triphosphate reductase
MYSFELNKDFVNDYKDKEVPWGYKDVAGNSFGELVFINKYSRLKEDGYKEHWYEVCERVINGMYSIQKDHIKMNHLPWNDNKAQRSAQEAYDRMFNFKWSPPGRGLEHMGSPYLMATRDSMCLQNCAVKSTLDMTKTDPSEPFCFIMLASALGVGVGFDTRGAKKDFDIYKPGNTETYVIPDSREGWVESLKRCINSYLKPNQPTWNFDYSEIRPYGTRIKTFGGTASGPEALKQLHERIAKIFDGREGTKLTSMDILDMANMIGAAIVAGGTRRTALLALGDNDDDNFLNAKNSVLFPERNSFDPESPGWAWSSNNSVYVTPGEDYSKYVDNIVNNGEPGFIWLDFAKKYGRTSDPEITTDQKIVGVNPCGEQFLESGEFCTLGDIYINRHTDLDDFKRTAKFAFLYAKTVTLLPTRFPESNAIMQRNRRIGLSTSGIADFYDEHGPSKLREWQDEGYKTVREYDKTYSEWLCVRESVKVCTVKPAGTTATIVGVSPGVHWSLGGEFFLRAFRMRKDDPVLASLERAGYTIENDVTDPDRTRVVYFPIKSISKRSDREVSMWEKALLAVDSQRYWSDNAVSVTVSFDPETEGSQVAALLHSIEGKLKTISLLPRSKDTYPQMPYTQITEEEYWAYFDQLNPIDTSVLYMGDNLSDAQGDKFCNNDHCEVV